MYNVVYPCSSCHLLGKVENVIAAFVLFAVATRAEPANQSSAVELSDDAAEFRQASGMSQQLVASYPNLYGSGYQYLAAASQPGVSTATGGSSYGNMLRQFYRPTGLTDKVRNWVKSFLNRRQYNKPYYNPSGMLGFNGAGDDVLTGTIAGKPMFINGASYKPISVPLRQLQKYFKPFSSQSSQNSAAESAAQYLAAMPPRGVFSGYSDAGLLDSSAANLFAAQGLSGSAGLLGSGTSGSQFFTGAGANAFAPSSLGLYSYGSPASSGGTFGSSYLGSNLGSQSGGGNGQSVYASVGGMEDLASSSSSVYQSPSVSAGNNQYSQSGSTRNTESFPGRESQQSDSVASASYAYDTAAGNYPVESAYSYTYQRPPQAAQQSYGSPAGFQPVSFAGSEGSFKGIDRSNNAAHQQSSAIFVSDKSS